MNAHRVITLIGKELREFRSNPAAIIPMVILVVVCVALPFVVLVVVPEITGESLSADTNLRQIVRIATLTSPGLAPLPPDAAVQAFLFQQFLLLFLVAPI